MRASISTCKRLVFAAFAWHRLTRRARSFECDGTIAGFDGFADWSVVDRNTQPVDNVTPPVRRTTTSCGDASAQAASLATCAHRSMMLRWARGRGAMPFKRRGLTVTHVALHRCSASAASWTLQPRWRARRRWHVSVWCAQHPPRRPELVRRVVIFSLR
jgi:hypothetical protein